jgi:hypothetical protein
MPVLQVYQNLNDYVFGGDAALLHFLVEYIYHGAAVGSGEDGV